MRSYLNLKTYEHCSPRERNDLRGEKFTAPINRTKTYFVNRGSIGRNVLFAGESEQLGNYRMPVSMVISMCTV